MLVLTAKRDDVIMIGDDIKIVICGMRGRKVRVGIKTPSGVPVHRRDVWLAIQRENETMTTVGSAAIE